MNSHKLAKPTEYFDIFILYNHIFLTDIVSSYLNSRIRIDQTVCDHQQTEKIIGAATFFMMPRVSKVVTLFGCTSYH